MVLLWERLEGRDAHELGRLLLARAVGSPLPEIALGERGKPGFVSDPRHFSVTHTHRHVFVAVSDRPVGIDAEEMDRIIRPTAFEHLLSPQEKQRCIAFGDKNAAFLRLWVQKEAEVKRTGAGLTRDVNKTNYCPGSPAVQEIDGCYVAIMEDEDAV